MKKEELPPEIDELLEEDIIKFAKKHNITALLEDESDNEEEDYSDEEEDEE